MSTAPKSDTMDSSGKMPFAMLVRQVLSLDSAIKWVGLEEAGRGPRWAWRDPESGEVRAGTTTDNALLVDPLTLMLAEYHEPRVGRASADSHRLRFIVLDYVDLIQIVARFGSHAHISVAIDPGTDGCELGTKLLQLLNQCTYKHAPADMNC